MAFLCFILLVQPNSIKARQNSNSRYLLIELDGSPDMEPETLPEEDDEGAMPETEIQPARKRNLNANALPAQQGGYRSSN